MSSSPKDSLSSFSWPPSYPSLRCSINSISPHPTMLTFIPFAILWLIILFIHFLLSLLGYHLLSKWPFQFHLALPAILTFHSNPSSLSTNFSLYILTYSKFSHTLGLVSYWNCNLASFAMTNVITQVSTILHYIWSQGTRKKGNNFF